MKLLLLTMPECYNFEGMTIVPPLGLQYLAANVNCEVKIVHQLLDKYDETRDRFSELKYYHYSWEELLGLVKDYNPEIVGLSCMFAYQFHMVKAHIDFFKIFFPKIKLVFGGNMATAYYLKFGEIEGVDIICGEGEIALQKYIDGTWEKGKIYKIENIDEIKYPLRNNMGKYWKFNKVHDHIEKKDNKVVSMITSRGCAYNCIFCSVKNIWGKGFRPHLPEYVLGEVKTIKDIGATEIHFEDDNLVFDKERMLKICEGLKKYKLRWTCPNGIDLSRLDEELLVAMKDSGCYRITICPESYNDHILKFYRKPFNTKIIKDKLKLIKSIGFETAGFFILGAPMETFDDILQTAVFSKNFDSVDFGFLTPYLGTDLYDYCIENNLLEKKDNPEDFFIFMQSNIIEQIKNKNITKEEWVPILKFINFIRETPYEEVNEVVKKGGFAIVQ